MQYPQLTTKEKLPAGSRWIQNSFYFAPDGRFFMVPENGYEPFVFPTEEDDSTPPVNTPTQTTKFRYTATATTLATDDFLVVYTTAGITQALNAIGANQIINLKNISGGSLTITGNIDGVTNASVVLSSGNNLQLYSTNTTGNFIAI